MTRRRSRLRLPWTLLACALVLAVVLGVEWRDFGAEAPTAPQALTHSAPADETGAQLASFTPPPAERYDEVTARPLFVPERRPAEPVKPAPPPPALKVEGVVLSPERRSAIIEHGNPPKLDSITEGMTIEGWRVESISRDRVSLREGTTTVDIPIGTPGQPPPLRAPIPSRRNGLVPTGDE